MDASVVAAVSTILAPTEPRPRPFAAAGLHAELGSTNLLSDGSPFCPGSGSPPLVFRGLARVTESHRREMTLWLRVHWCCWMLRNWRRSGRLINHGLACLH